LPGRSFQIFGFDILLDKDLKAWILEINDHPSLNIYFDNEEKELEYQNPKKKVEKPKEELILSYVDLHTKR
jgi:hypothetical protein